MGEVTVKLNRDAAGALLKEARSEFENGARELWRMGDESQRPTIEATVEVIGKLAGLVEGPGNRWPHKEQEIGHPYPIDAEIAFTEVALGWMRKDCGFVAEHVAELDHRGEWGGADPGYLPEQVFLLHVLRDVEVQELHAHATGKTPEQEG